MGGQGERGRRGLARRLLDRRLAWGLVGLLIVLRFSAAHYQASPSLALPLATLGDAGLHPIEQGPNGPFRWTDGAARMSISGAGASGSLHLRAYLPPANGRRAVVRIRGHAAIYAGTILLAKAGALAGRPYTTSLYRRFRDMLGCFDEDGFRMAPLVESGHVITAQGSFFADFGLRLAERLGAMRDAEAVAAYYGGRGDIRWED
ncbi:MAG TPA: hypothetical protein VGE07_26545 [Herpetosiphonaceae bacterium]